jgi:hypothetical protein
VERKTGVFFCGLDNALCLVVGWVEVKGFVLVFVFDIAGCVVVY